MDKLAELVKQVDGIEVVFELYRIHSDYLITAAGGQRPHIGAVSLNAQTMAEQGHKEDVITTLISQIIRDAIQDKMSGTGQAPTVCVVGGIHVDHITKTQIVSVVHMCETAAKELAESIINCSSSVNLNTL